MPKAGAIVAEGSGNRKPEARARMAEAARRRWADPEKRAVFVEAQNRGKLASEEYKNSHGSSSFGPNRQGQKQTETEKRKRRDTLRRRYEDPSERAALVARAPRGQKRTRPETVTASALNVLGEVFEEQVQIDGSPRVWDLVVRARRLIIEVDGCYWHGCETCRPDRPLRSAQRRCMEKDAGRADMARNLGFGLLRVWEHDTLHGSENLSRILSAMLE